MKYNNSFLSLFEGWRPNTPSCIEINVYILHPNSTVICNCIHATGDPFPSLPSNTTTSLALVITKGCSSVMFVWLIP